MAKKKKTPPVTKELSTTVIEPSSGEEDDESMGAEMVTKAKASSGASRLFVPYRSLGILSDEVPFYLLSHQSSASSHIVLSIGDRFQMLQCDKLQPVLVSQALPSKIVRLVSDSSLSLTAVAHGSSHLTLFSRLTPLVSKRLSRKNHKIVDLLHLGMMKVAGTGEKEGKDENAMIIAAILCNQKRDDDDEATSDDKVPLVGDDNIESSDDDSDSDDDSVMDSDAPGEVVIMVATRTSLYIQNRCDLPIHPTVSVHPSAYVNKILVGGHNGGMVLVNIRSGKVIHQFKCLANSTEEKGDNDRITSLEQSPAVDTVAVGCRSGKVHLVNLRRDKRLFGLSHNSPVTALSFRTDASAFRHDIAPLAVGRQDGTVSIWDLSDPEGDDDDNNNAGFGRTLLCEMKKLHPGGVSGLQFMPQEPLLVSTGKSSNSVLMHVFDNPDHSGRLWKSRKGHTSPPQCIRYLHPATNGLLAQAVDGTDASACQILSGGSNDRTLRIFSSARSVLDKEYSQGQGLEKRSKKYGLDSTAELLLPPIVSVASAQARSRDWGDLVTIHKHHAMAYVWSTKQGAQSGPVLRQSHWNISAMKTAPPKSAHATSLALSSCGNYAIVGTKGGTIYKYNIQSGMARGKYPPNTSEKKNARKQRVAGDINRTIQALEKKFKVSNRKSDQDKEEINAIADHEKEQRRLAKLHQASHQDAAVTGLAVDAVNKTLISVGDDAKLILWNFVTHAPHKRSPYMLPAPATKLCHVRDSDLASIALDDFSVVLFDCSALQIVRRFGGDLQNHTAPITDMAFAPDGRSLYTASLDCSIRVWDVPTNHCVDWLAFKTAPTSITVSPTGEFLATTHADRLGISMWSDRTFYQTVFLDTSKPPEEPAQMDDPVPIAEIMGGTRFNPVAFEIEGAKEFVDDEDSKMPPEQKSPDLATMSGLPPAHWKNLFHLELVKERNKPSEAPKKPPTAPFFLQWRGGEDLGSSPLDQAVEEEKAKEEEWAAAWSDDDDGKNDKQLVEVNDKKRIAAASSSPPKSKKRRVVTHHRSHLASLLQKCHDEKNGYQNITDHMATLGPSAIDISLSTLCNGMHDLQQGLPLLHKASQWLLQAIESRQRYEAIQAYMHRFLYLHAAVIAGIQEDEVRHAAPPADDDDEKETAIQEERVQLITTVAKLREVQSADGLKDKMQHSLCLLRHFLRMV